MAIKDLKSSQKKKHLFINKLSDELDHENKLYQLNQFINWDILEKEITRLIEVNELGRERKALRVMIALAMLQSMYNFSDRMSSETFEENLYWRYFCGYEYVNKDDKVSESCIRRFRQEIGEEGYNIILKELIKIGLAIGLIKKKDIESPIIDTTVQNKNIKYPHDGYLLGKAREELVKLAHNLGIKLHETYEKKYKENLQKLWKYRHHSKAEKKLKTMQYLKSFVSRVLREFETKLAKSSIELKGAESLVFAKIKKIHAQSFLSKEEKKAYKKQKNKIIYSFHAEEVECIAKGKLHKPYEFGNKVAISVSGEGNFILGVKSFHDNPYDGHTLAQTIAKTEENTSCEVQQTFVDLGYRGNNYKKKGKVYTPYTKKKLGAFEKKMQKRRSAIEPVIGHLKQYGRMARNFLKGVIGDLVNPLISAIGFNLRNLANKIILSTA
jgi:IS5 family transposase